MFENGLFAKQFPVKHLIHNDKEVQHELDDNIAKISDTFTGDFYNTGFMVNGKVYTIATEPLEEFSPTPLKDVLQHENEIDESYYITDSHKLERFNYLRGYKSFDRIKPDGSKYTYTEGSIGEYEDINKLSRTILTSEGLVNRCTHFLKINNRYRTLTPIEAERLQYFPDDWTKYKLHENKVKTVSDRTRLFFMGNALVTDIVKQIGLGIKEIES